MKSEVTAYVRPIRHAYFILADDLERFIEVASFCCTQWGGINNLIVPITVVRMAGKPSAIQIDQRFRDALKRLEPLFFIDAASDRYNDYEMLPQIIDQLQTYVRSLTPDAYTQPWHAFKEIDDWLHPLFILPTTPSSEQQVLSQAIIPSYQPITQLERATIIAAFGRIWPGQEKDYAEALEMSMWPAVVPDLIVSAQHDISPSASVINFTRRELHNLGSDPLVFDRHYHVIVAQTCADLCWYWAMRAASFGLHQLFDRRVLVLTKDQLLSSDYFDPLVQLIRTRRTHPTIESNLDMLFHHDDDEIEAYLSAHPELEANLGPFQSSMTISNEEPAAGSEILDAKTDERKLSFIQRDAAKTFYLNEVPAFFDYGGRPPTYSLDLNEGVNSDILPGFGLHISRRASVWLSVRGTFLDHVPLSRGIGALLVQQPAVLERRLNAIWLSYRSYLTPAYSERVSITLRPGWELYQAYFSSYGHHVEASDKLAYANGLLELAGGLDGADALRSRFAYHLLDLLADKSSKKLAQAVKAQLAQLKDVGTIANDMIERAIAETGVLPRYQRNPKTFADLWNSARQELGKQVDKAQALTLLGNLVRIGVVQRGFNVRCPRCSVVSWFGIGNLDERVACPGCLTSFPLPLTEIDKALSDRSLEYSLNPLANRAMDQDVLPVILSLLSLKTIHPEMAHVMPGMLFRSDAHTQADGDFDFVYTRKSELYIGECKAGNSLGEKDLATMRFAQSMGARAFFFASMKSFNEESMRLIENAKAEVEQSWFQTAPFSVIVLSGAMLFGEEQLPRTIPR